MISEITTLNPHGDVYLLVIDQKFLDLLKIQSTTLLDVRAEAGVLTITPLPDQSGCVETAIKDS